MKISYNKHKVNEIKNIIESKSKYQKVMLLFDDYVSNLTIAEIYNEIKDVCIYNQCKIDAVDEQELNNGYRLIVYLCGVDSFLKIRFSTEEYINVFCPLDSSVLPYFLNQGNCKSCAENYLILDETKIDVSVVSSVYFNRFYNYLKNLLSLNKPSFETELFSSNITTYNMIKILEDVDVESEFLDVGVIKASVIAYADMVLVDLLLIDAFLLLLLSIKNQTIDMVDIFKSAKEDIALIDKFFKFANNESFINLILLNYNCLYNFALATKKKILECLISFDVKTENIENVITKIKGYAKHDNGICGYLYLYNVFGV